MTTPISISDYTCNLIAGQESITNLYYAVDRSRAARNNGQTYCYKVVFAGIGSRTYQAAELVRLDNKAESCSTAKLLAEVVGKPTLDQFIMLLLNQRIDIQTLYQTQYRAMYLRSAAKVFCYKFTNPFGAAANVSPNSISFRSTNAFLTFFNECSCKSKTFDPRLIVGAFYL